MNPSTRVTVNESWPFLQSGDTIAVVAPSSPPSDPQVTIQAIQNYFANSPYGLKVSIPDGLIAPTSPLGEANTIEKRVAFIEQALHSDAKAVWAIMGGGWGAELMPRLSQMRRPAAVKPVIGYSDVTALHVFFNQVWGWPTLQSVELGANGDISSESAWNKTPLSVTLDVLTGKKTELTYALEPFNAPAREDRVMKDLRVVGGNNLIVSAMKGTTLFNLNTEKAILFIESVGVGPGVYSRILHGLAYSPLATRSSALLLGSAIEHGGHPNTPESQAQFDFIQNRVAADLEADGIPVLHANNLFGHGPVNMPLPFNTQTTLVLGAKPSLTVSAN